MAQQIHNIHVGLVAVVVWDSKVSKSARLVGSDYIVHIDVSNHEFANLETLIVTHIGHGHVVLRNPNVREGVSHAGVVKSLAVGGRGNVLGARALDLNLGLGAVEPMDVALVVVVGSSSSEGTSRLNEVYTGKSLLFHQVFDEAWVVNHGLEARNGDEVGACRSWGDFGRF